MSLCSLIGIAPHVIMSLARQNAPQGVENVHGIQCGIKFQCYAVIYM